MMILSPFIFKRQSKNINNCCHLIGWCVDAWWWLGSNETRFNVMIAWPKTGHEQQHKSNVRWRRALSGTVWELNVQMTNFQILKTYGLIRQRLVPVGGGIWSKFHIRLTHHIPWGFRPDPPLSLVELNIPFHYQPLYQKSHLLTIHCW